MFDHNDRLTFTVAVWNKIVIIDLKTSKIRLLSGKGKQILIAILVPLIHRHFMFLLKFFCSIQRHYPVIFLDFVHVYVSNFMHQNCAQYVCL